MEEIKKISRLCEQKGLKLHLDGARVFNALVAADYSARDLGEQFDTLSVCLSKGLGAPVGSLLLGTQAVIKRARRLRKIWGGGMRQAGLLAAAGTFALEHNIERLVEDHQRAECLGAFLEQCPYVAEVLPVYTNIVIARFKAEYPAAAVLEAWEQAGLRAASFGPQLVRLTTHLQVDDAQVEQAGKIIQRPILETKTLV